MYIYCIYVEVFITKINKRRTKATVTLKLSGIIINLNKLYFLKFGFIHLNFQSFIYANNCFSPHYFNTQLLNLKVTY